MAETFLLLTATFMFCFLLFLIVFLPVLFPYLSILTVTCAGEDSCPAAQNHSRHLLRQTTVSFSLYLQQHKVTKITSLKCLMTQAGMMQPHFRDLNCAAGDKFQSVLAKREQNSWELVFFRFPSKLGNIS